MLSNMYDVNSSPYVHLALISYDRAVFGIKVLKYFPITINNKK